MDLASIRYIADGFPEDAEDLLMKFTSLETFDYAKFVMIWREKMFSLVYMGREKESELNEFTQEIFSIPLSFIKPTVPIYRRTGALYLLYGLYIKQPLDPKCKIRILLDQWNEIVYLYNFAIRENISHLSFVILKFLSLRAFHCVAFNKLMGPTATMTWDLLSMETEGMRNLKRPLMSLADKKDYGKLEDIHNSYLGKIDDLVSETGIKFDNNLFDSQYESLGTEVEALAYSDSMADLMHSLPSTSSYSRNDIGSRRSELKRKQFEASSNSQISSRINKLLNSSQDEDDDDDDSDASINDSLAVLVRKATTMASETLAKKKKIRRYKPNKRPPRGQRRRGRPSTKIPIVENRIEEDDDDDAEDVSMDELTLHKFDCVRKTCEKAVRVKQHFEVESSCESSDSYTANNQEIEDEITNSTINSSQ